MYTSILTRRWLAAEVNVTYTYMCIHVHEVCTHMYGMYMYISVHVRNS